MVNSITTNTTANTALRYLDMNSRASSSSLAKLSSGSRIVRASDDAASLAVGTKLRADVTALKQAQVNASQASSLLQVADGAMAQTTEILIRMKSLAAQSLSGQVSDNERGFINAEYAQLVTPITDMGTQVKYNNTVLLDGNYDEEFVVGVAATDIITVKLDAAGFDLATIAGTLLDVATVGVPGPPATGATGAMAALDTAIADVNEGRANLGALLARFEYAGANLATTVENIDAARSVLLDVDMAAEMSNFSSKQVLMQASVAMLAQANQQPEQLLRLLQ
jgi:flagellin